MTTCPECGRDTWLYDANTWTCKLGHKTPFDTRAANLAPTIRVLSPAHVIGALVCVDVAVDLLIRLFAALI